MGANLEGDAVLLVVAVVRHRDALAASVRRQERRHRGEGEERDDKLHGTVLLVNHGNGGGVKVVSCERRES